MKKVLLITALLLSSIAAHPKTVKAENIASRRVLNYCYYDRYTSGAKSQEYGCTYKYVSDSSNNTGYTDTVYTPFNGSFTVYKRRYNYTNDVIMGTGEAE